MPRSLSFLLALLSLCFASAGAGAAVEISFYSRELGGSSFPHAFVTLKGTLDRDGRTVDEALGFTAKSVTPALLMGSVGGKVVDEKPGQIARSDRQFSLVLTDERYDAVMAVVERWRTRAQPSYNLNRANCVHFAGELAQAAGLTVEFPKDLMKKPRSFLLSVRARNSVLLASDSGAATAGNAAVR
jgi:hypothetical protein